MNGIYQFIIVGIKKVLKSKGLGKLFSMINLCGSYGGRNLFCDDFTMLDIIRDGNVILGGDLNLTIKVSEIWAERAM